MAKDDILSPPRIKWLVEPTFDDDGVQRSAGLDAHGREIGDPIPLRPPVGLAVSQGDELHTALRNLFIKEREAWRAAIQGEEFESEEEANDFIVEEDLFPPGNEPWEDIFEFPAEEPGASANGSQLASGAVKGGSRGPEEPTPPATASQTVSSGSSSGSTSSVTMEQKPTGVSGDIGKVPPVQDASGHKG